MCDYCGFCTCMVKRVPLCRVRTQLFPLLERSLTTVKSHLPSKQVYDYKRYRNLFEEEKKRGYGHKQYKNLPEDETQKLIEYRKIISKCIKILLSKI